ncbi:5-methyltetrahydropteroyltriglutamate--homocysteine S-methyltransferase [Thermus albus]|uniref:5-methyltetrahydropteroyltriglutamate-- homocysteine S-methyltransferase n=1 Tax=Thermus albus TaxID=2908146 RepID=UPI001FAA67AC|nr:5-methyltetrahydropteroyltriglutamate--homocysteine S-methyltransferase [Thermus albus]
MIRTLGFGLPRLGPHREYKRLLEEFWKGGLSKRELLQGLEDLEAVRVRDYRTRVDLYPAGEMSLYDPMLDLAVALGLYPVPAGDLEAYFALARGKGALPLRKWFGTNYHHLVPRLPERPAYTPNPAWFPYPVGQGANPEGLPTLIGPYTFLRVAQNPPEEKGVRAHLEALLEAYRALLAPLAPQGRPILLQEPALGLEEAEAHLPHLLDLYRSLAEAVPLVLLSYYLPPAPRVLEALAQLPMRGLAVWFHPHQPPPALAPGTAPVVLAVEGQGVWRTDLLALRERLLPWLEPLLDDGREVILAPKAPLFHLPWRVSEPLPPHLEGRLAFAEERLEELRLLKGLLLGQGDGEAAAWYTPPPIWDFQPSSPPPPRPPREVRHQAQGALGLPRFPTTTIGSLPQTQQLRELRLSLRSGRISPEAYEAEIQRAIQENIRLQEELGLDVLVHGEPERSDMVEFFAERLEGFYTTQRGFVLSYGSRVWRPPILHAPPRRREALVLRETLYAQSLTPKPVKAILTGPITLAAWSYLPEGVGFGEAVLALAEALREEVEDLKAHGIRVVQVDEPALLERMPLRDQDQPGYVRLVQEAFHRVVGGLGPGVQVHLHLCYSDYRALRPFLEAMDPDVVSVEGARQDPAFLSELQGLPLGIGPGVFDVHSPEETDPEEMLRRLEVYLEAIPEHALWINPDCGLKTRSPEEALRNLRHMMEAARRLRARLAAKEE